MTHIDDQPTEAPAPPPFLIECLDAGGGATAALISLNRPDDRNPLDAATMKALRATLEGFLADGETAAVIITGRGDAFSAGGDLKGYQRLFTDASLFSAFIRDFDAVCNLLETSPMVSVAMINGVCVAGGLELALACDVVTIADEARIGDGHLNFAQIPGAGSSQRLMRALGAQQAKYWLLSGRIFDSSEAVDAGLALLSAPADELQAKTMEIVTELCRTSPLARQRMKELIAASQRMHLDEGLAEEMRVAVEYATTSFDAIEGLNAFAERRQPNYKGR